MRLKRFRMLLMKELKQQQILMMQLRFRQ